MVAGVPRDALVGFPGVLLDPRPVRVSLEDRLGVGDDPSADFGVSDDARRQRRVQVESVARRSRLEDLTSLELVTSCLLGLWIDFRILKFLKLKSQKFANIKDTLLNVHLSLFLHYEHVHIIGFMASCQMIMFMSILALLPAGKDVKTISKNYDHHFHSEIINLSNTVYMYIFQPASG